MIITHDQSVAATTPRRVEMQDGRIRADGSPPA